MWSAYDGKNLKPNFASENRMHFDIEGDGEFRTYQVELSAANTYKGAMNYLVLKPGLKTEEGAWVKVKSIRLGK